MIKQLLSSLREYGKHSVLSALYVTFESVFEILIPTLMAYLIDYGINKGNLSYVLLIGLALAVAAMLSLLVGYLAGRSAAIASCGLARNLRHDVFHNVQELSFSNIDKFSTDSIITRLTTDITNVQNAFQMLIRLGVRSPTMLVFALVFSMRIDLRLSMIFLAAIPVLGVGLWLIMSRVHPIFRRVFTTYDRLNNVVQENLCGIRVVKSYNREDHEQSKFEEVSQSIFLDFSRATKRLSFNMPLMQLCLYASMILLSWFGAKEIIASNNNPVAGLSTGELTSLITYAMQILMSLMMLSMVFVMIIVSRASAERVTEILNEKSDLGSRENAIRTVRDGSVTFENVTFAYARKSDKPVLNGINVSIASGETVGVLGGTGASKSSFVQLIPRLYDVVSGRVTVGGLDVRDYDVESL
ncbi:MAG TPA: ABC transporter transmembrane domain-containing protein, partial [Thermodesulfobacteriota bacterium]|nr:ABC transporter transmembrane domain-containing protein [Thermodesulfobacteriota bacterium]